jgi:hypothetical protein
MNCYGNAINSYSSVTTTTTCRKMDDFRRIRDYEEAKIASKAKWVQLPMKSWADEVTSPDWPETNIDQRKECKYSSAKSAEASARRRFAKLHKEPEDPKAAAKKKSHYNQTYTDSKGRILGARESGEAGALSRSAMSLK